MFILRFNFDIALNRGIYLVLVVSLLLILVIPLHYHTFSDKISSYRQTHTSTHILQVQAIELSAFYLKAVLWIPTESPLNLYRLLFLSPVCAVAAREIYQYGHDP